MGGADSSFPLLFILSEIIIYMWLHRELLGFPNFSAAPLLLLLLHENFPADIHKHAFKAISMCCLCDGFVLVWWLLRLLWQWRLFRLHTAGFKWQCHTWNQLYTLEQIRGTTQAWDCWCTSWPFKDLCLFNPCDILNQTLKLKHILITWPL